jgi:hypothetical protein
MAIDEVGADASHTDHPCLDVGKTEFGRDSHHPAMAAVQLGKEVTKMTDRRARKTPRVRDEGGKQARSRTTDGRSRDKRSDADRNRK